MCQFTSSQNCYYEETFSRWTHAGQLSVYTIDPLPVDEKGNCLFHSTDLKWKKEKAFFDHLIFYINQCQLDDQVKIIDISNATIIGNLTDTIDLSTLHYIKPVRVKFCLFEDALDLKEATFSEFVNIYKCIFNSRVYFNKSKFYDRTQINDCTFNKPTYFNDSEFISKNRESYVSFTESTFNEQANFSDVKFSGFDTDANFQLMTFRHNVYFTASVFERYAIFNGTTFEGIADFRSVLFKNGVVFNDRLQNDQVNIVKFDKADFSSAQFGRTVEFQRTRFSKTVSFDDVSFNQSLFRHVEIQSDFLLNNAVFGLSNFDKIFMRPTSRILFSGSQTNKVFTQPINFDIDINNIKGLLIFDNVKLSWISKKQINTLQSLHKKGKVQFHNDCLFEANVKIIQFKTKGSNGNYLLLKKIFQHLEEWISLFTNNIQAYLLVDASSKSRNEIKIKVVWQREEDEKLFQKLAKYFFECLNERSDDRLTVVLDGLCSERFLRTFSNENNEHYSNLNLALHELIKSTLSAFDVYIKDNKSDLSGGVSYSNALSTDRSSLPAEKININQLVENLYNFLEITGVKFHYIENLIMNNIQNSDFTTVVIGSTGTTVNSGNGLIVHGNINMGKIHENKFRINDLIDKIINQLFDDDSLDKNLKRTAIKDFEKLKDQLKANELEKPAIEKVLSYADTISSIGSFLISLSQLVL